MMIRVKFQRGKLKQLKPSKVKLHSIVNIVKLTSTKLSGLQRLTVIESYRKGMESTFHALI